MKPGRSVNISWRNGWLYIGRAYVYRPDAFVVALFWNNRWHLPGTKPEAGEFVHADRIEWVWLGRSRDRRCLDHRLWTFRRHKMNWRDFV